MSQTLSLEPGKYALYIAPPVAGVDFTGTPLPSVSYQWKKNGTAIAGQTNATISGVWVEQSGGTVDLVDGDVISIDIILTNPVSVATKTISATIDSAIPAPVISPVSVRQLSGGTYQTVTSLANTDIGEQVIVASNTGGTVTTTPPVLTTYQWRRNSIQIAGATAQTYTLQAADADSIIDCVVTATNSGGTTTATATVVVGTVADAGGWTELIPSADSRLIYVSNDGDDVAAANAKGRGYYLPSDPEIGSDPTNPVGPIVAYGTPLEAVKRFRGRNWNGTSSATGIPNYTFQAPGNRNGYPDWLLFRRGETFAMPAVPTDWGTKVLSPAALIGNWSWTQFSSNGGGASGRSASEPGVVTAWGPPTNANPIVNPFGPDANSRDMALVSIETTGGLTWSSLGAAGSNDGRTADGLLLEDIKATSFGYVNVVSMIDAQFRRCVVSGGYNETSHNQGMFLSGGNEITIEECIFDRNGYKDSPTESRSWRGSVVSPSTVTVYYGTTPPDIYPYAGQTLELWDVATNTLEWTGVMPATVNDTVGGSYNQRSTKVYEFPSPTPLVPSNPERMAVLSSKWYSGGVVHANYGFDVFGAFTITGEKQIRVLNAVTGQTDTANITIGVAAQPLRTFFDRNLYMSAYNRITLRGNIISRGGGGGSVQIREGGLADRNLFIWNQSAISGVSSEMTPTRHKGSLFINNVALHDDHFLPPGGWGTGLIAGGADDDLAVLDGNIVAHFHRWNNGGESLGVSGKLFNSSTRPASKLMRGIVKNNAIYRESGGVGIMVMDTIHEDGVLDADVTGNAVSTASQLSMQGNSAKPIEFVYTGNKFHSPTGSGLFRWGWESNNSGDWRHAPFTDGTFAQWQSAGFDTDGTFTNDFAAFKSAVGWTAPERDIVSYMQSVDPTYVVNEDVYVDEESAVKQTVRQKVWEVLVNWTEWPGAMTEAQAKRTARRYHAFITFIQRAKANRKGAWDTRWTAEAVNNYIREGFGKAPVTGPYDDRSLATRLAEYAS